MFFPLAFSRSLLNKICDALFIDFAKAFDVISHNLLLKKMNLYGLTTDTLNLIRSFLSDRHLIVSVKNKQAEIKPVVLVFHKDLF